MYETAIGSYTEQNKTEIDLNKRIRKICLRLSDKKSGRRIWGIRFVDENGKKVMSHSWNKAGQWVSQVLDPDEEIIGLYGRLSEGPGIRSLGFIVWRRTDWSISPINSFGK